MIAIEQFRGDPIDLEKYLNEYGVRWGIKKIISISKIRCWYLFGSDEYLVTYEKEEKQC